MRDAQRSGRRRKCTQCADVVLVDHQVLPKGAGVDVRVLYLEGCPSRILAAERLRCSLDAAGHQGTPIQQVHVESVSDPAARGFAVSPTVMVDGQDLFPGAAPVAGLACRLYSTSEGVHEAPIVDALLRALA